MSIRLQLHEGNTCLTDREIFPRPAIVGAAVNQAFSAAVLRRQRQVQVAPTGITCDTADGQIFMLQADSLPGRALVPAAPKAVHGGPSLAGAGDASIQFLAG